MNYYKKRKIKDFFKDHWKALVGTGSFLLAGVIVMLVGFAISGWSLLKWLESPFATTFFIMLVFGIIGAGIIIYLYARKGMDK